jgi:polyferredoxin/Fe-S-cluster-containing dehydrogenase component
MKALRAIDWRRISQVAFLLIFLGLFLTARDPLQKVLPPDLLLRLDPLAGLLASVSDRAVMSLFWPALLILALAFILGRSFCGWACPLGTTLDIWNRIVPAGRRQGSPGWKYALLVASALLALFSLQAVWLLDPLVIFHRTLAIALYPLTIWGIGGMLVAGFSWPVAEGWSTAIWNLLQGWLLPQRPILTAMLTTTALVFSGILALEMFGKRFWCRVLCPLGALLGLIARFAPFGRKVDDAACSSCSLCGDKCRMGAIEGDFSRTRRAECILCLECAQLCEPQGTTYTWGWQGGGQEKLNLGRRRTLGTIGAAAVFAGVWRTSLSNRADDGYLIRPPGAVEENHFLDLCLRCQACVKACSSTGRCLQPSGWESGWDRVWTPRARMREGYCEYSCTLCGQVCPSGAIQPLSEAAKKTRVMGLAYINRSRCIPWERGEDCIVCEEHCPTPRKAILFRLGEVELPQEVKTGVKLPYVDRALCIGCGICETKCPLQGESAIRVTREGEQRKN